MFTMTKAHDDWYEDECGSEEMLWRMDYPIVQLQLFAKPVPGYDVKNATQNPVMFSGCRLFAERDVRSGDDSSTRVDYACVGAEITDIAAEHMLQCPGHIVARNLDVVVLLAQLAVLPTDKTMIDKKVAKKPIRPEDPPLFVCLECDAWSSTLPPPELGHYFVSVDPDNGIAEAHVTIERRCPSCGDTFYRKASTGKSPMPAFSPPRVTARVPMPPLTDLARPPRKDIRYNKVGSETVLWSAIKSTVEVAVRVCRTASWPESKEVTVTREEVKEVVWKFEITEPSAAPGPKPPSPHGGRPAAKPPSRA